ncbi:MAG: discoidin domain-containing protein [Anaerolineaceae bacterium]
MTVVNYALGKSATQSSDNEGAAASRAVDGNINGDYTAGSVTHTNADPGAWWQVDLEAVKSIGSINLFTRTDCCTTRTTDVYVLVSDVPFVSNVLEEAKLETGVSSYLVSGEMGRPSTVPVNRSGRYVRVQLQTTDHLSLAEVMVLSPDTSGTPTVSPTPTVTTYPTEPTPEPLQHAWYLYNGDGTMVKGIVNSTSTYYPGRHYNLEVNGTTEKAQKFYFAGGATSPSLRSECFARRADGDWRRGYPAVDSLRPSFLGQCNCQ